MAFDGRYKLVVTEDEPGTLYDPDEDPEETINCIHDVDESVITPFREAIAESRG